MLILKVRGSCQSFGTSDKKTGVLLQLERSGLFPDIKFVDIEETGFLYPIQDPQTGSLLCHVCHSNVFFYVVIHELTQSVAR